MSLVVFVVVVVVIVIVLVKRKLCPNAPSTAHIQLFTPPGY